MQAKTNIPNTQGKEKALTTGQHRGRERLYAGNDQVKVTCMDYVVILSLRGATAGSAHTVLSRRILSSIHSLSGNLTEGCKAPDPLSPDLGLTGDQAPFS